jgi:hypothetical protein
MLGQDPNLRESACCSKKKKNEEFKLPADLKITEGANLLLGPLDVSEKKDQLQDIKQHIMKQKFIPIGAKACKVVEFINSDSDDDPEGKE